MSWYRTHRVPIDGLHCGVTTAVAQTWRDLVGVIDVPDRTARRREETVMTRLVDAVGALEDRATVLCPRRRA